MLGSVRLRGHADANLPPRAARPLQGRAARRLHPPRRRAVRAGRRAALRPGGPLPAPPEPGAGSPARLGQRLRRPGPWRGRCRAAARPAGRLLARRRPAGVRGGCHHLAALRRRMLPGARLLLPSLAPLGRPADAQVRALLGRLPDDGPVPLVVFDAGYDSAQLTLDLAEQRVAVLVRLRSDRCFYADPPPPPPGKTGRPRRHGAKFAFADPATWPAPTATLTCQDDQYGTVTVQAWAGLHPKQQRHPGHGSGGPRPIVRGTIIRVQVQRVPAKTRPPKVLWLWWAGPKGLQLELDLAWRAYIRRFDLEHTVRFAKQTLGWTTPRPRHPEQADRWTWLVLACYAQLRLARAVVADTRLPWERPRPPGRLSPVRVCRGFPRLLVRLGSPAVTPKPSGRSPGRPKGSRCGPARR